MFVREAEAAFPSFYLSSLEVRKAPRAHSQSQNSPSDADALFLPLFGGCSRFSGVTAGLDGGPISDPRQGQFSDVQEREIQEFGLV